MAGPARRLGSVGCAPGSGAGPGARAFVVVPESPPRAGRLGFLVFEPTGGSEEPCCWEASRPPLLTVPWRKQGSRRPGARGFVVGPQDQGAGDKPGQPLCQDENTGTPSQKVAQPQRRRRRRRRAPILRALGEPGPRSPPLRSPCAAPSASLLPGRPPRLRRGPRLPHSLCAPAAPRLSTRPAGSWLPLLAPSGAPGVFPAGPTQDSPPPGASRLCQGEGRRTPRLGVPAGRKVSWGGAGDMG